MNQPLIQNTIDIKKLAQLFRDMADRMELNATGSFGGCFVVVPPAGNDSFETLILDSNQDVAQFYVILKTKAEMALAGIDEAQRNQRAFGR